MIQLNNKNDSYITIQGSAGNFFPDGGLEKKGSGAVWVNFVERSANKMLIKQGLCLCETACSLSQ
jgi:hypothetical protein